MTDILYIDDDEALASLLASHDRTTPLSADTEFLREKTYHARLCLLQLAAEGFVACIDPIAGLDMTPLWQHVAESDLTLHAARQDLELFISAGGRLPARVFDTQIAAGLAGLPPQLGYAALVKELLGVELPKHHTRTDWSRRPLKAAEIDYAADDVRYLGALRELLAGRLEGLGRLEWALADSAELLQPELYEPAPEAAWQRLRAIGRMDGKSAAAAAALATWREHEALRANRPRQWILRDAPLLAIAQARPRDSGRLSAIDGVPAGLVRRAGRDIIAAIETAGPPPTERRGPPGAEEKALVTKLASVVRKRAGDLGIEPEIIASQKELRQAVSEGAALRALGGWRGAVVGEELRALLADQPATASESRP